MNNLICLFLLFCVMSKVWKKLPYWNASFNVSEYSPLDTNITNQSFILLYTRHWFGTLKFWIKEDGRLETRKRHSLLFILRIPKHFMRENKHKTKRQSVNSIVTFTVSYGQLHIKQIWYSKMCIRIMQPLMNCSYSCRSMSR